MKAIAYVANSFPEPGETYVWDEIRALRSRGQTVIPCSFWRPRRLAADAQEAADQTRYVLTPAVRHAAFALFLLLTRVHHVWDLISRVIQGREPIGKKLRTLAHTLLGACLAADLRKAQIGHIHVHHGYFASWAGLVCARLLRCSYSLTLHGSDLLVRRDYLDCKLRHAAFCVTISHFNRNYILDRYPAVEPGKIRVHRLGVDPHRWRKLSKSQNSKFTIVSAGRLHAIKNYEFLIRACHILKLSATEVRCVIAGDGENRGKLHHLINNMDLQAEVELPGHIPREQLPDFYARADLVVFTSHSEGIPIAAMEAMAMEGVVLAPAITGVPELIAHGKTGLLYQPNSMIDFVTKLKAIRSWAGTQRELGRAARMHVQEHFDRVRNLELFTNDFLQLIGNTTESCARTNAYPVLQQI
jgi:glycosyltransferase involved in cell wall biosynthesis